MNYGRFDHQYGQGEPSQHMRGRYRGRMDADLGDTRHEPRQNYRLQHSREYGRRGGEEGMREDRYLEMYDISNYTDQPRSMEYGLPMGAENDLDRVERFPYAQGYAEGPYGRRPRHYSYNMGTNPNYDNPEEGDRYRDFDSRGNHGYRHDAAYGNQDAFRDFGDDHYGSRDRGNPYYGYFGGYNR